MERILTVCTANQCRSPSAAFLMRQAAERLGIEIVVDSAGIAGEGDHPVPAPLARVAAARGIDLSAHRSKALSVEDLRRADLVLGMAREHVRSLVVMDPATWPRAFTLREFVRRASLTQKRGVDEPLQRWLEHVAGSRVTADLMGESFEDDIEDPIGGPDEGYESMLDTLAGLCTETVQLAWGTGR